MLWLNVCQNRSAASVFCTLSLHVAFPYRGSVLLEPGVTPDILILDIGDKTVKPVRTTATMRSVCRYHVLCSSCRCHDGDFTCDRHAPCHGPFTVAVRRSIVTTFHFIGGWKIPWDMLSIDHSALAFLLC